MLGQLVRFSFTGLVNTGVDFIIFNALLLMLTPTDPLILIIINSTAVMAAAANSFMMNRSWTFSCDSDLKRTLLRFILVTAVGMLLNNAATVLLFEVIRSTFDLTPLLAANAGKITATVLSASWNFAVYRGWVFTPAAVQLPIMTPGMISLIIPAFNEENRIIKRLTDLEVLWGHNCNLEILVVDDGSRDHTAALVQEYAGTHPGVSLLSYSRNCGKGRAVRTGVTAARGEYIVYVDADQTFTPDHIQTIIDSLRCGHPMVLATRCSGRDKRLDGESPLRTFMGRSFNMLVQLLLLPGCQDSQCGLKGFHRHAAMALFTRQKIDRFAFDVELLSLARSLMIPSLEIPVWGQESGGSRVNCLVSPVQMLWDLFKIKLNLWTNRYDVPGGSQTMWDWTWCMGLFSLALAIRLPWLWEVPRFIDELKEVELGYLIYLGKTLPLHNAAHDIGALHNYILALLFHLFGPSPFIPRLYVAVTSALTVVLTYLLGRKLHSHAAGLLAAGLLTTSGMHVLVTHMAWSNCTTPFFFMLALLVTCHAWDNHSRAWLTAAGFLWGLTLQTHASAIIYAAAAGLFFLLPQVRRTTGWTRRDYLFPLLSFAAAYGNMIYYNLISGGGSVRWLGAKSYALETDPGAVSYITNLQNLMIDLLRTLSSTYTARDDLLSYLASPLLLVTLILLIYGIFLCKSLRWKLPVWLALAGILVIPLFNQRYAFYVSTRYIMPIVLLSYLLISLALVHIWSRLSSRSMRSGAAALMIALITWQALPYYDYCRQMEDTNNSNRMAFSILNLAGSDSRLVIDENLPLENEPLPYLLTLRQQPFTVLPDKNTSQLAEEWQQIIDDYSNDKLVAVMNDTTFDRLKRTLSPSHIECLSCRVVIPYPTDSARRVWVIQVDPRREAD